MSGGPHIHGINPAFFTLYNSKNQPELFAIDNTAMYGDEPSQNQLFNCFQNTESVAPTTTLWIAPQSGYSSNPVPVMMPATSQHVRSTFHIAHSDAVAVGAMVETSSAVTTSDTGMQAYTQQQAMNDNFKASSTVWNVDNQGFVAASACPTAVSAVNVAALQSNMIPSEQAARRQYYYQRHHGVNLNARSNNVVEAAKNKYRFSATGASVDTTVVRDCKMSLNATPPSPSAGSIGGSIGGSAHPFNPMLVTCMPPNANLTSNNPYFSSAKKPSDMSTSSSILSSYSSSSLSSNASTSGVSPRKRRADELEEIGCPVMFPDSSSRVCSTGEVTEGVNGVRLSDRSHGSISPIDPRKLEDHFSLRTNKRSKNANQDDDDVVFVSAEPPKPIGERSCQKVGRKSKKTSSKRKVRASVPRCSPTTVPVSLYTAASGGGSQHQNLPKPVAQHLSTYSTSTKVTPSHNLNQSSSSAGYFLRSTVSSRQQQQQRDENNNVSNYTPSKYPNHKGGNKHRNGPTEVITIDEKRSYGSPVVIAPTTAFQPVIPQSDQALFKNNKFTQSSSIPTPGKLHSSSYSSTKDSSSYSRSSTTFKSRYETIGVIGVGGGGKVYAGTRKADNVQVAIKQVPKEKVKRWGALNGRVVPIEFQLLHQASFNGNEGVIKMLDWYEKSRSYILVMERPQPEIDLFDYLNQHGALPEKVAKKIFRQIVKAVCHCHANGVIHRDIKDENVILNLHTSEAKLIDFGCGTFLKETQFTEFAGTPEFYPPEWFTDRRYWGKKVDAWSLGVLLYTMIEAEVPFQKEKDIIACQLRHKRAHTTTTQACRDLIARMLQKDQNLRPTLDQVLADPWLACNDDEGLKVQSKPPTAAPSAPVTIATTNNGVMSPRDLYTSPTPASYPNSFTPVVTSSGVSCHRGGVPVGVPQQPHPNVSVVYNNVLHHHHPAVTPNGVVHCVHPRGNECIVRS